MSSPQRVVLGAPQPVRAIPKDGNASFVCHSETANAIFLAGSFNDWSQTATRMTKAKDSDWTVSLGLAPGRYEYKFVVDGEWCCEPGCTSKEPHCPNCVVNEFGTMNRVLQVE